MIRTTKTRRLYGRDHWSIAYNKKKCHWSLQRAHSTEHGYRLDPPLPGHTFATKKAAQAAKRALAEAS